MLSKLFKQLLRRKLATGIILLIIVSGGYLGLKGLAGDNNAVEYITAEAERGTLISSISASGQVSVSDQIDIMPKVSGEVTVVYVTQGQEVKTGTLLAKIDSADAERAVRDAETSLETAKLELDKLLEPLDELTLLQAENSLIQAEDSLTKLTFTQENDYQKALDTKQKAEDNLEKAYEDEFNIISNTFLDLPAIITGLKDILYSYGIADSEITVSSSMWNITTLLNAIFPEDRYELNKFTESAEDDYKTAREKYDQNFENYKDASRYSEQEVVEALLEETLETTKVIAEAVKSENNMLDFWVDYRSQKDLPIYGTVSEYQSDLESYTKTTNSHLLSLLAIERTIKDNHEAIASAEQNLIEMKQNNPLDLAAAERTVIEKEKSLAKLKVGPDDFDIRAKKITIQQREDALLTAKQNLAKYFVRAPFGGVVAKVNAKRGQSVSSGTTLATLITKQRIAEVTLNEIDIAQVEIGQLTTLTFDAVEDVTLTGKVIEIDALGVVSQGVVTYNLKIAFDTQDERIKPGMTIDAAIITNRKDAIVLVPNAAVQTRGGQIFVDVLENGIPQSVPVKVGFSNEISTEIISGLEEGAQVVTARLGGDSSSQTANVGQSLRIPGIGGGGGFRGGGGFISH